MIIEVQRLGMGARFFGAVENGDSAGAFRQRLQQMGGRRTIEANFQDTDFSPRLSSSSTTSSQVPIAEPIITITRSACGWP